MFSWEEFVAHISENADQNNKLLAQAELEAQAGATVVIPRWIWVAQAV